MLSKAAAVTSVRREISHKTPSINHTKTDKDLQKQDYLAQKSFWLGVTSTSSILASDRLKKSIRRSKFQHYNPIEKVIHDNSKEVCFSLIFSTFSFN